MNRLARITSVELRLFLREPMTVLFGIALPPLLLVIFGSIPSFAAPNPDLGGERFIDVYAPALIATSLAMLITLFALLILGPDVIFGFTAAITLGIFVGTYSSIFMSAPILIWLRVNSNSFVQQESDIDRQERLARGQG